MPDKENDSSDWQPVESAPWQKVLEVRNPYMDEPCLATRGYAYNGMVHPNPRYFTTVYTPDRDCPTPAGEMCCPTEWRLPTSSPGEEHT